jgi:hypothetical protein
MDRDMRKNTTPDDQYCRLTRRSVMVGLTAFLATPPLIGRAAAAPDHAAFEAILNTHVVAGADGLNRVRYADLKRQALAGLGAYIAQLQAVRASALPAGDQMAFWINLYNAKTLQIVAENYPVTSIKDIDLGGGFFGRGPWKAKLLRLEGHDLSLDNIEHDILRKKFPDPLIHYALNCASVGCPNLHKQTYRAATLDDQLRAGARAYVNHPRGLSISGDRLTASKIYRWYAADFGGAAGLSRHWAAYAEPELKSRLAGQVSVDLYVYDWSLNDAG